jgi:hypothetical protein
MLPRVRTEEWAEGRREGGREGRREGGREGGRERSGLFPLHGIRGHSTG